MTLVKALAAEAHPTIAVATAMATTRVQQGEQDGVGDAAHVQLVIRSRRGDAAAFAALVDAYERVALAIAFSVTSDANGAGDVVQDAFLRAWQRVGDLKEPEKFGAWLCGIVRNLAIDAARARAVRAVVHGHSANGFDSSHDAYPEQAAAAGDGPFEELDRRDRRQRVTWALDRLDEMSRSALVLRYYDNLSSRQIGELLGLAPTAVDMRLMRARRQLRGHLMELEEGRDERSCVRNGGGGGRSEGDV